MSTIQTHRHVVRGFTLVEMMIVVAILGVILAIAVPGFVRARNRSRQRACQENLSKIQGAKEQWAMETNVGTGTPDWADLIDATGEGYLKERPICPGEGTYSINDLNSDASCTITSPLDHSE